VFKGMDSCRSILSSLLAAVTEGSVIDSLRCTTAFSEELINYPFVDFREQEDGPCELCFDGAQTEFCFLESSFEG